MNPPPAAVALMADATAARPRSSDAGLSSYSQELLGLLDDFADPASLANELGASAGRVDAEYWERALFEPLRDLMARNGKGIRTQVVRWAWHAAGGQHATPRDLAYLVELLHLGSLVVDDIQDDAVLRRGAPALHRVYGTARALNAGNWLYFWPARIVERMNLPVEVERDLLRLIDRTLWRCHAGQGLDVSLHIGELRQLDVPRIVQTATALKTGALMGFAAASAALVAGADPRRVAGFATAGGTLGVGLQMLDDYGALVQEKRRDKAREDLQNGAPTWPWAWAAERSSGVEFDMLQQHCASAETNGGVDALRRQLRDAVGPLGLHRTRQQMNEATSAACAIVQTPADLEPLRAIIAQVERAPPRIIGLSLSTEARFDALARLVVAMRLAAPEAIIGVAPADGLDGDRITEIADVDMLFGGAVAACAELEWLIGERG